MSSAALLDAAIDYAAKGWPVFPLAPRGKVPLAGSKAFYDATTDPEQVRRWWATTPDANIGIATGQQAGFFALDIDPRNGGGDTLRDWEDEHGKLPDTAEALPGGGDDGRHLLLRHPPGGIGSSPGTSDRGRPGIDVKGDGGYIVAAPSIHPSGHAYEWELSSHPDDTPIAPAPAWLLHLLRATEPGGAGATEAISLRRRLRDGSVAPGGVVLLRAVTGSVAPHRKLAPDAVVERCRCGAGERDAKVLELARGLKWNAGIEAVDDAMPWFWQWHERSTYRATARESEKAFRHAWINADCPLDMDVPRWAFELARDDEPPAFADRFQSDRKGRKTMTAMIARRMQQIRGDNWWIDVRTLGRLIGCDKGTACRILRALEEEDPPVLLCTRRGRGGAGVKISERRPNLYRYVAEGLAGDEITTL